VPLQDEAKDGAGRTPLHRATYHGRTATVELLIAKGAAIDAKDCDGQTPLHLAAFSGHTAMAGLLIAKGAAIDAKDCDGRIPLHYAARYGHTAMDCVGHRPLRLSTLFAQR
jgi:ankyrin repeat protein